MKKLILTEDETDSFYEYGNLCTSKGPHLEIRKFTGVMPYATASAFHGLFTFFDIPKEREKMNNELRNNKNAISQES